MSVKKGKKKALSAAVLNQSMEQRQLLCMYLLYKMRMRMKKVLKLEKSVEYYEKTP